MILKYVIALCLVSSVALAANTSAQAPAPKVVITGKTAKKLYEKLRDAAGTADECHQADCEVRGQIVCQQTFGENDETCELAPLAE